MLTSGTRIDRHERTRSERHDPLEVDPRKQGGPRRKTRVGTERRPWTGRHREGRIVSPSTLSVALTRVPRARCPWQT